MQKNGDAVEELQDKMLQLVNDMIYFSSLINTFPDISQYLQGCMDVFFVSSPRMKIILKFSR